MNQTLKQRCEAKAMRGPLLPGSLFLSIALCLFALAGCGRTFVEEELPNEFSMPAGVEIHVTILDPPHAANLQAGQSFTGTLAEPLYYEREKVDPTGLTFEEKTLVAPIGVPVSGVAVASAEGSGETIGLKLESITFHGGMTFPVESTVLELPANSEEIAESDEIPEAGKPITFTLAAPADVALVMDFRENHPEQDN